MQSINNSKLMGKVTWNERYFGGGDSREKDHFKNSRYPAPKREISKFSWELRTFLLLMTIVFFFIIHIHQFSLFTRGHSFRIRQRRRIQFVVCSSRTTTNVRATFDACWWVIIVYPPTMFLLVLFCVMKIQSDEPFLQMFEFEVTRGRCSNSNVWTVSF